MDDSAAMTIEFLRARLLAERSVSRTAKLRADELAKRVMELEKQLQFLSLQRKKAEKGIAEVLAILENHGMSDLYETYDSCSDGETEVSDSKLGTSSVEGDEKSGNYKKFGGNNLEEVSGSEIESSSLNGRCLSWKSRKESVRSSERKYLDASRRRRNSFASTGSSSPKHLGKSCRKIRHKEQRSAVEARHNNGGITLHENEFDTNSKDVHISADVEPEKSRDPSVIREQKELPEVPISEVVGSRSEKNGHCLDRHGGEDMERALHHQAHLIGRYEAEEKAQREWEDKYKETNGSALDLYDHGNQSDITEEREETKVDPPHPHPTTEMIFSRKHEEKIVSKEKIKDTISPDSPPSDSAFSAGKGKHGMEYSGDYHSPQLLRASGNDSTHVSFSPSSKVESLGTTNELAVISSETSGKLESVLEALHKAKLSLNQNLNGLPLRENGSIQRAAELPGDGFALPVMPSGLFRLPSDYQLRPPSSVSYLESDPRSIIANHSPIASSTKVISRPYMELGSGNSADYRLHSVPTFQHPDIQPGIPAGSSVFEPRLDAGLPPSINRYINLDRPQSSGLPSSAGSSIFEPRLDAGLPPLINRYINLDRPQSAGLPSSSKYMYYNTSSYPESMPRVSSEGRVPAFRPSREVGMPPLDRSFYDHGRPYMYR